MVKIDCSITWPKGIPYSDELVVGPITLRQTYQAHTPQHKAHLASANRALQHSEPIMSTFQHLEEL